MGAEPRSLTLPEAAPPALALATLGPRRSRRDAGASFEHSPEKPPIAHRPGGASHYPPRPNWIPFLSATSRTYPLRIFSRNPNHPDP